MDKDGRRRAARFARSLEERGITTALRPGGVAILAEGHGEALRRALARSHPELFPRTADGKLLLDIGALAEEEFSEVAAVVAAELRGLKGAIV